MAKILMIHPDKCTGCQNCMLACSFQHEGQFRQAASRIHVYSWEREGFSVPMMCQQCSNAPCVTVCPTGALSRNKATGVIEYNAEACIRCRMCAQACPFGNAVYDMQTDAIIKCDTCGGDPACVQFCPNGALEFVEDTVSTRKRKKAFASKFKDAFQEVN